MKQPDTLGATDPFPSIRELLYGTDGDEVAPTSHPRGGAGGVAELPMPEATVDTRHPSGGSVDTKC